VTKLETPQLPPISQFTKMLATPEMQFEKMVKEATKIPLPPGPQSTLLKLQSAIEAGKAPSPEEIIPAEARIESILAKLPTLPALPFPTGGGKASGTESRSPPIVEEKERRIREARVLL